MMTSTPTDSPLYPIRRDWLAQRHEAALAPDLPVVDPHHHLWVRGDSPYLWPEFRRDIEAGHRIVSTVFMECHSHYRPDGPAALRPVGETAFAAAVAEAASLDGYPTNVCEGIVGNADLREGAAVREVLEAHIAAGAGRFKGIRQIACWHPDSRVKGTLSNPPAHLLADRSFRSGFAQLDALRLSFDAWVLHTQLDEVADLAHAFPGVAIILNHAGGAIGVGPYAGRRDEAFAEWSRGMERLAKLPNVMVKLGGFGMRLWGFDFFDRPQPPSSEDLAAAWRPFVDTCVNAFGASRCMCESNFPVDNGLNDYVVLWNAFKRLVEHASKDEQADLLWRTAARAYRLEQTLHALGTDAER